MTFLCSAQTWKSEILGVVGGVGIGVAERIEGRDRVRLKGNGETESFKRTELATNRQKNNPFPFFFRFFPRAAAAAPPPPQSELRDGVGCVL